MPLQLPRTLCVMYLFLYSALFEHYYLKYGAGGTDGEYLLMVLDLVQTAQPHLKYQSHSKLFPVV